MATEERKVRSDRSSSADQDKAMEVRRDERVASRDPWARGWSSPIGSFRRIADEMERRLFGRSSLDRSRETAGFPGLWMPQVETFQRDSQFVVRADLPGLKASDVTVEVLEDSIVIEGERHNEHEEKREGYYATERSYGSFHREVPLPEGAIADSAKATFKNGVLEVTLEAPPRETSRGRRLEIDEQKA